MRFTFFRHKDTTKGTLSSTESEIIRKKHEILIIVALCFLIRFFVAIFTGGFIHGDEIFQSLEIAHKMAFGSGFVCWEWDAGVRSYFYPLIFYGIFKGCEALGLNYFTHTLFIIKLFNVFIASLIPPTIYLIALEFYKNRRVAFMASLLCCFWHELLYYGIRSLTNSFAMPFIFLSVLFFLQATRKYHEKNEIERAQIVEWTITRGFFSGVMCGIAFMARIDSVVFVAPIVVWGLLLFTSKRRGKLATVFFVLGLSGMVLLQGTLDLLFYGQFLWSPVVYFKFNLLEEQSATFGVKPFDYYFSELWTRMTVLMILFVISLCFLVIFSTYEIFSIIKSIITKSTLSSSDKKQLIVSDLLILSLIVFPLLGFSFIPHKEFRFILSLIPWILLFVSRGAMVANQSFSQFFGHIWNRYVARIHIKYRVYTKEIVYFPIIILFFISLTCTTAVNSFYATWSPHQDLLRCMHWIGQQDDATGVIALSYEFYEAGGYTHLHKDIPMRFSLIYVRQKEYNYLFVSFETLEQNEEWEAYILDYGFQIIRLTEEHVIFHRN